MTTGSFDMSARKRSIATAPPGPAGDVPAVAGLSVTPEVPVADAGDAMQAWTAACEAATRTAFDAIEQGTHAWAEMQALLWLWPLHWWAPSHPLTPDAVDAGAAARDWFGKFLAGTTPPQPVQEATREWLALGLRSWTSLWAPWTGAPSCRGLHPA